MAGSAAIRARWEGGQIRGGRAKLARLFGGWWDIEDVEERGQRGEVGEQGWVVRRREVEAIAERVVELLRREDGVGEGLIDAAEVARRLGVSRGTVYEKADELGAVRLGEGPRARLRFDPKRIGGRLVARGSGRRPSSTPTPLRDRGQVERRAELLPVRGPAAR